MKEYTREYLESLSNEELNNLYEEYIQEKIKDYEYRPDLIEPRITNREKILKEDPKALFFETKEGENIFSDFSPDELMELTLNGKIQGYDNLLQFKRDKKLTKLL